jgi:hypothetical protein
MRLALLIALLLAPMAAHADPVTAAVAAFAAWAGVGVVTVYLVAATVVLSTGMAIYGAAQARRAERDAKNAANAAMQDRMATKIAAEAPHVYVYGRAKVGGAIVAMFTSGDKDQYKHIVCVLAAHECDAVEEVYINNVAVGLLNSSGDATTGRYAPIPGTEVIQEQHTGPTFTLNKYPVGVVQAFALQGLHYVEVAVTAQSGRNITIASSGSVIVNYQYNVGRRFGETVDETVLVANSPYVRVQIHLGGPTDPADAYLMSVVPGKWTSTSVLRGLCYLVVTLDLNNPEFQGGQVPIQALVRGRKLYDPRTGLTAWSQNPALGTMDYLTSPLCGVSLSDLPVAQYITAANVCAETSVTGGLYTMNGTATSDQNQATVLESMAQCMAGGIVSTTWDIYAGKYVAPVIALDQSDIIGALSITPGASDAAIYNGVKGQFISPDNSYVLTDFAPFQNPTYLAADGRDLYTDIPFPFTDSLQRVHNLARIFTEDMRNGFTMKAEFSLKAWPIKVGQRVTFTSAFLGQSSKIYRVTDKSYAPNSAVELTLKEDAASIWDFADAVTVDSTPNTNLPDPWAIAPLASLSCTSGVATLLTQADGSIVPRILVTWPVATTAAVFTNGQIEIEWRAISTDTWQKAIVSGGATETYLSPITPGYFYVIRARTVNPYLNTKSNWVITTYQVAVSTVTPTVYQWSKNMPAMPSGAASYTWSSGAFGAAPTGWSLTAPAAPAGGDSTLWSAIVSVSDISITGSTPFNWNTASISAMGYAPPPAGTGPTGPSGTQVAPAVSLYQWSSAAPSAPTGTSTLTWATGANSAYSAADNWFVAAPTNPGTPGIKLFVATVSVSAAATVTTSTVSYSGAAVSAWSQNGATGPTGTSGIQSGAAIVYQWAATIPSGPAGSATYTWSSGAFGAAPTGWALNPGTSPSPGFTLWQARAGVTDSAANATTAFNWTSAAITAVGYAGQQGSSYVTAYCDSATATTTTTPAATTGSSSVPAVNDGGVTGTWQKTVPTGLASGHYMWQSDGIYNPATNQVSWSIPYWSYAKFGSLSAISANLGQITAGSIDIGTGATSWHVDTTGNQWAGNASYASAPYRVSNAGAAVFTNVTIMTGASTIIDASGLKAGYEAPGTKNSDIAVSAQNLIRSNSLPTSAAGFTLRNVDSVALESTSALYDTGDHAVGALGSVYCHATGTPAAGTRVDIVKDNISTLAVVPGRRYEAGVNLSTNRCAAFVIMDWYNSSGTYLGQVVGNSLDQTGATSAMVDFTRSIVFGTAPAGAAFAMAYVRQVHNGVQADPYTFASQWYIGEAGTTQTVPTKWTDSSASLSSSAANGATALAAINDATTGLAARLRNNAANVLAGGAGLVAGSLTYDTSGNRTGGFGVAFNQRGIVGFNSSGVATITMNVSTGAIAVAGDISGSTGTFGDVIIGTKLYSGMTAWSVGSGIWMENVGGVVKVAFGSSTEYMRWSPSAGLELKLATFSVVLSGTLASTVANGSIVYGGLVTATITGGVAPFTYSWSTTADSDGGPLINYGIYSGQGTSATAFRGSATNNRINASITVIVTDSRGFTATGYASHVVTHGTYIP